MSKKEKLVIMTIGRSHSGKTTFADNIKRELKGGPVVIQTDPIAEFLAKNFPKRLYSGNETKGDFDKPALKLSIYDTIIEHALETNQRTIIFANSNLYKDFRKKYIDWFREHGYKVVGVYLNYPERILKQRVDKSDRDNSLLKTNDFKKLIELQRKLIQRPKADEFDYFYEIKDEKDLKRVKNLIIRRIRKNNPNSILNKVKDAVGLGEKKKKKG